MNQSVRRELREQFYMTFDTSRDDVRTFMQWLPECFEEVDAGRGVGLRHRYNHNYDNLLSESDRDELFGFLIEALILVPVDECTENFAECVFELNRERLSQLLEELEVQSAPATRESEDLSPKEITPPKVQTRKGRRKNVRAKSAKATIVSQPPSKPTTPVVIDSTPTVEEDLEQLRAFAAYCEAYALEHFDYGRGKEHPKRCVWFFAVWMVWPLYKIISMRLIRDKLGHLGAASFDSLNTSFASEAKKGEMIGIVEGIGNYCIRKPIDTRWVSARDEIIRTYPGVIPDVVYVGELSRADLGWEDETFETESSPAAEESTPPDQDDFSDADLSELRDRAEALVDKAKQTLEQAEAHLESINLEIQRRNEARVNALLKEIQTLPREQQQALLRQLSKK